MLRNYLKVAVRYLVKHKGYTIINVLGLSVGIACCVLIMLFVKSEWSFDRFHSRSDRIYRAWLEEHYEGNIFRNTVTPVPLAPVLQSGLPEVAATCRVSGGKTAVKYDNNTFNDLVTLVDSNFFSVFDFAIKEGNVKNPFPTANSVVITKRMAKKYFGNHSAIGKSLEIELTKASIIFTVSGVAKDPPLESSIQFDLLIPFSNAIHVWSERTITQAWSNVAVESYFLLEKGTDVQKVNTKVASIMNPLVAKTYTPGEYLVRLQPLKDIHFNATLPDNVAKPSDPKYTYILATLGLLILLIACINFVTLSIGRSATRALEVGIRKVLGAERQQLVKQFWGEALLLTALAMVIGIGLAMVLQKPFNQFVDRDLYLNLNWFTLSFLIVLMAVIALLAGIYPAFILSNFRPIEVLKGKLKMVNIGLFRKALIVGQFVASIVMIIGTLAVGRQLKYLRSKDLGYNREHVIVVPTNKSRLAGNALALRLRNAIEKNPDVIGSTTSLYSMAEYGWMNLGYKDDKDVFRQYKFNAVDASFVPTMGLQIIAGRNFRNDSPADSNYVLVNEAFVKEYGWKNPIGQRLPGKYEEQVIGVVKDFNFETLHTGIKPLMMALRPDSIFRRSTDVSYDFPTEPRISVRFRGGDLQQHIAFLKSAWKSVAGDIDFEYQFLDDALNAAYQQEQRLGRIAQYASFLSIFIACMGLFGLVTLIVVRRTKEIGIRKVLGADVTNVVALLSKDFVILVMIASLIAFPLAWWGLHTWLQDFTYRIAFPWLLFIAAAAIALFIALLTVSIQAVRAALMNPVKSLRTE
jgi:putative ABC transport system permease protein